MLSIDWSSAWPPPLSSMMLGMTSNSSPVAVAYSSFDDHGREGSSLALIKLIPVRCTPEFEQLGVHIICYQPAIMERSVSFNCSSVCCFSSLRRESR